MTTTTAPAPVSAPATANDGTVTVKLEDLSTAQLSERMTKLAERHDTLKASVAEFESVRIDFAATLSELQKRMGAVVPSGTKKEGTRQPRAKKDGDGKFPSLKEIVLSVLGKNPNGLELKGIVAEVQGMIDRKEYASTAKSLSAVVSQAVNALKQENLINHDRDSKKYSRAQSAA